MPKVSKGFIPSVPVRIGETIYAQDRNDKLFSFDINTKQWEVCDGMNTNKLSKYIGANYIPSNKYDNSECRKVAV